MEWENFLVFCNLKKIYILSKETENRILLTTTIYTTLSIFFFCFQPFSFLTREAGFFWLRICYSCWFRRRRWGGRIQIKNKKVESRQCLFDFEIDSPLFYCCWYIIYYIHSNNYYWLKNSINWVKTFIWSSNNIWSCFFPQFLQKKMGKGKKKKKY